MTNKTIIGLKLTHDASIAVIKDDTLMFCTEFEKLPGGVRYTACNGWADLTEALHAAGIRLEDADSVVVDGWKSGYIKTPTGMAVAPYHEHDGVGPRPLLQRFRFHSDVIGEYSSFTHTAGHVMGAWAVSPFAPYMTECHVITWDGGMPPRLNRLRPATGEVEFLGILHPLYGLIYGIMGYYFGPYKKPEVWTQDVVKHGPLFGGYDVPGKLMSYIALGNTNHRLKHHLTEVLFDIESEQRDKGQTGEYEHQLCRAAREWCVGEGVTDEDALATIHTFLEELLVNRASAAIPLDAQLIFCGGSALNIKWNTALRECGNFADVFVPPFPNDSGSAIGAAVCEAFHLAGRWFPLEWDVYCGPAIPTPVRAPEGWWRSAMTPFDLGKLIAAETDQAFVVLAGRAEVGPRALGHRSIFMSPERAENKKFLNDSKRREPFRPVAPICLEEFAADIFDPGSPDPFMLFDHAVRKTWVKSIPAVVHLDNTARLQTINDRECPTVAAILRGAFSVSGCPLLCNTSANFNGAGFFSSVAEAVRWAEAGGVKYVWHDGSIYIKD